jgi:hypothetical protein
MGGPGGHGRDGMNGHDAYSAGANGGRGEDGGNHIPIKRRDWIGDSFHKHPFILFITNMAVIS